MQEAKHTPGPWEWCGKSRGQPCSCGYIFGAGGNVYVAKSLCLNDEVDPVAGEEDRSANARLIAAAPELLEALSLLLEAVEMDIALFPDQPHKDSRVGKARAAIAKATASEGAI